MSRLRILIGCGLLALMVSGCKEDETPVLQAEPTTPVAVEVGPSASSPAPIRAEPAAPLAPPAQPLPIPDLDADDMADIDPLAWVPRGYAYAPLLPRPEEQFFEMKNTRVTEFDSPMVVLCRVIVTGGNFDWLAEPDLVMELQVAGGPVAIHSGGLNESVGYVSYPLPRVSEGAPFHLKVLDQDITEQEFIGETSEEFHGFPVEIETRHVNAVCRARSLEELAASVTSCLGTAGAAHRNLLSKRPRADAEDFGFPANTVSKMRSALSCAAAYVGWEEPRVAKSARELAGFEVAFSMAARKAVEEKRGTLGLGGEATEVGPLELTVVETNCRPYGGFEMVSYSPAPLRNPQDGLVSCEIVIDLNNRGAKPLEIDRGKTVLGPLSNGRLVTPNGATAPVAIQGGTCFVGRDDSVDRIRLDPGMKCRALLGVSAIGMTSGAVPGRPVMLRFDASGHEAMWLAL